MCVRGHEFWKNVYDLESPVRERKFDRKNTFQNSYFEEEIPHKEKFEKKMMKCTMLFSLLMVCASAYEKREVFSRRNFTLRTRSFARRTEGRQIVSSVHSLTHGNQ